MSGAPPHEVRGGLLQPQFHASTDTFNAGGEAQFNYITSTATSTTEHDFRFPRRPSDHQPYAGIHSESAISRTGTQATDSSASAQDKLDPSAAILRARNCCAKASFQHGKMMLRARSSIVRMRCRGKDPLATQIWKLYSKTKKQLPNQERMENLTWRMMAMNLRKRRQEEAARVRTNFGL